MCVFWENTVCVLPLAGEVRCFFLDDLTAAAEERRPLRLSQGQVWLRPPVRQHQEAAEEYPQRSSCICLHGLQLFYVSPRSTRVERMGSRTM